MSLEIEALNFYFGYSPGIQLRFETSARCPSNAENVRQLIKRLHFLRVNARESSEYSRTDIMPVPETDFQEAWDHEVLAEWWRGSSLLWNEGSLSDTVDFSTLGHLQGSELLVENLLEVGPFDSMPSGSEATVTRSAVGMGNVTTNVIRVGADSSKRGAQVNAKFQTKVETKIEMKISESPKAVARAADLNQQAEPSLEPEELNSKSTNGDGPTDTIKDVAQGSDIGGSESAADGGTASSKSACVKPLSPLEQAKKDFPCPEDYPADTEYRAKLKRAVDDYTSSLKSVDDSLQRMINAHSVKPVCAFSANSLEIRLILNKLLVAIHRAILTYICSENMIHSVTGAADQTEAAKSLDMGLDSVEAVLAMLGPNPAAKAAATILKAGRVIYDSKESKAAVKQQRTSESAAIRPLQLANSYWRLSVFA
ncbi:hypothetical protein TWF696_001079 [Orbilia brochopaga]|uniref:Uncharacterized protein n=1 Tax=Orbilia brochopaga TaxID=3140254 RepID=A0AAV9VD97_9PEZI